MKAERKSVCSQVKLAKPLILTGPAAIKLESLPSEFIQASFTSPPYYRQKDYSVKDQIGWEPSVTAYIDRLIEVLRQVHRVTMLSGCCFIVVGDTFIDKSLQLVPQRLAISAVELGWTLRNDLIWAKTDGAPDGASDRWRFAHEHILFLTKQPRGYKFNADAIRVPYSPVTQRRWGNGQQYGGAKAKSQAGPRGQRFKRGKVFKLNARGTIPRDVLEAPTARSKLDHFATFPLELIEKLLLATTEPGDVVCDPFAGTATTGIAALRNGRRFVGVELNPRYARSARKRLADEVAKAELNGDVCTA